MHRTRLNIKWSHSLSVNYFKFLRFILKKIKMNPVLCKAKTNKTKCTVYIVCIE